MRFIFFLLCTFLISCSLKFAEETNFENVSALSVEELFLLLPAEVFYIDKYHKPTLSKEERQKILKSTRPEQAIALSINFHVDTTQSNTDFLKVRTINDDGVTISLKTWQRKDKSIILGVNISVGDMCCDYSRFKLFHSVDTGLQEVTEMLFPKLTIEDFVPTVDAKTKALFTVPIECSIDVSPENDFLKISIYSTPTVFDLDEALTNIDIGRILRLVWKKDRFLIEEE